MGNLSCRDCRGIGGEDWAYQREYRLVIAHEMPTDYFVRIRKLDNTKILETVIFHIKLMRR